MNKPNPYDSPQDRAQQVAPERSRANRIVVRAIEYTIAILLIIALMFAFLLGTWWTSR